jgi:hypothetical protein
MKRSAPLLKTHEVAGVGHMPMLMSPDEIDVIKRFLDTD